MQQRQPQRRSSGRTRRSPKRKGTWWIASFPIANIVAGQTMGFDVLGNANLRLYADTTIERTHMQMLLRPTGVAANCMGAFGMMTMDKDAINANAIPDPLDDDAPWMHWNYFDARHEAGAPEHTKLIDIRAKRKILGERVGLIVSFQLDAASATSLNISLGLRVYLLH